MTPEERRKSEEKAAKLLAKSQRQLERALKEAENTGLLELPLAGFKRRSSSATRADRALTTRPPRRSIRVRAADGTIPFHMRVTSVSKSVATDDEIIGTAARAAAAHQVYVERETALEEVGGQECATQEVNSVAEAAQGYIERDGAMTSSFGTIAETLSERIAFWGAVDAAERIPRRHTMMLEIDDEERLAEIAGALSPDAPQPLIDIMKSREAICVDTTMRRRVHEYLRAHKLNDLVAFDEGRGGVVQRRLVLELPADMTPIDRYRIAQRFCSETFEARNIRFHCAIHAPTSKNDDRNHHLHIVFYDRPTERIFHPETGASVWDFEVVETKKTASRHTRSTRPLQKPKDRSFSDVKWPKKIREAYCRIVNERRAEVGQPPIYHPMTYAEAGVDVEPVPVLTRREFLDLERGIDNPVALAKIFKRWERLALLMVVPEDSLRRPSEIDAARPDVKLPTKKTTPPEDLVDLTRRKAPASIVMAKALVGDRSITMTRRAELALERKAVQIAVTEVVRRGLLPSLDTVDNQVRRRVLDDLLRRLLADVTKKDRLLVEHLAALNAREAKMRSGLAALHPWQKSLPSRSLGDLIGRAGLGAVFGALKAHNAANLTRKAHRPAVTAADLSNTAEPVASAATPQIVEETATDEVAKSQAELGEPIIAVPEPTVAHGASVRNTEEPTPIAPNTAREVAQPDEPNAEAVTSPPITVTPVSPVLEMDAAKVARNAEADYLRAELGRLFGRDFVVDTIPPEYQTKLYETVAHEISEIDALIYINYVKHRIMLDKIKRNKKVSLYYADKPELKSWDYSLSASGFMPRGLLRPGHFPKESACHLDHPGHAIPEFQYASLDYIWITSQLPDFDDPEYVSKVISVFEKEDEHQWETSEAFRELERLDELKKDDPKAYRASCIHLPFSAGDSYERTLDKIRHAEEERQRQERNEKALREIRNRKPSLLDFEPHDEARGGPVAHQAQSASFERPRPKAPLHEMKEDEEALRRRRSEEARAAEAREQRRIEENWLANKAALERLRAAEHFDSSPVRNPGSRYIIEDEDDAIARDTLMRARKEPASKVHSSEQTAEPLVVSQRATPAMEPVVERRRDSSAVQAPVRVAATEILTAPPLASQAVAARTEPPPAPTTDMGAPPPPPTKVPPDGGASRSVDRSAESKRAGIIQNQRRRKDKGWGR